MDSWLIKPPTNSSTRPTTATRFSAGEQLNGHFITFEGVDGCGKTTQRELTAAWLREQGMEVLETVEPGGSALGMEIRQLLLNGEHVPVPEAELMLFLADRAQHVREVIMPAIERGAVVLCDRYTDSTRAYQLAGRGLNAGKVNPLEDTLMPSNSSDCACARQSPTHAGEGALGQALDTMLDFAELGCGPERTLWFDLPVSEALNRMRGRVATGEVSTRMDDERQSFHEMVRKGFLTVFEAEPERVHRVDASGSVDEVQKRVREILTDVIA